MSPRPRNWKRSAAPVLYRVARHARPRSPTSMREALADIDAPGLGVGKAPGDPAPELFNRMLDEQSPGRPEAPVARPYWCCAPRRKPSTARNQHSAISGLALSALRPLYLADPPLRGPAGAPGATRRELADRASSTRPGTATSRRTELTRRRGRERAALERYRRAVARRPDRRGGVRGASWSTTASQRFGLFLTLAESGDDGLLARSPACHLISTASTRLKDAAQRPALAVAPSASATRLLRVWPKLTRSAFPRLVFRLDEPVH